MSNQVKWYTLFLPFYCSDVLLQSDLAFGPKGRSASAGRPRIPGGTPIVFDVEVVGLPGKEVELIDLIGD